MTLQLIFQIMLIAGMALALVGLIFSAIGILLDFYTQIQEKIQKIKDKQKKH